MPVMKPWMLLVESETPEEVTAMLEAVGYRVLDALAPEKCLLPLLDLIAQGPGASPSTPATAPATRPVAC